MKIAIGYWLVVAFVGTVACSGYAGVIPSSLIQSDREIAKTKQCKNLEKQHSEILKKTAGLKREEEHYFSELEKTGKSYCNETRH